MARKNDVDIPQFGQSAESSAMGSRQVGFHVRRKPVARNAEPGRLMIAVWANGRLPAHEAKAKTRLASRPFKPSKSPVQTYREAVLCEMGVFT